MSKFPSLDAYQNPNTPWQLIEVPVPSKLYKSCCRYEVSGSIFFQTVWAVLLHSYIGSDSVTFGNLLPLDDRRSSYECELRTVEFERPQSAADLWRALKSTQEGFPGDQFPTEPIDPHQSFSIFNTAVYFEEGVLQCEALGSKPLFERVTTHGSWKNVSSKKPLFITYSIDT